MSGSEVPPRAKSSGSSPVALSVAIITFNEEENLGRCLASLGNLPSEVVVVDSGSTDGTSGVANRFGVRWQVHPWAGYAAQKNVALGLCREPWVLSLDADEALTPALAASIRTAIGDAPGAVAGYEVCRRTWYLGDWIRHLWYPEWRLRLVRRDGAVWRGDGLHEHLHAGGRTARLDGDLLHYTYKNLAHHLSQTVRYAELAADADAGRGRHFSAVRFLLGPPAAALRQLVLRQGWRDGWRGWVIAGATAFRDFAREAFLLERQLGGRAHRAAPDDSRGRRQ